ncbi:MAG: hypothetical protein RID09_22585 [Coleofasciculus sp. G1-WW12-02]
MASRMDVVFLAHVIPKFSVLNTSPLHSAECKIKEPYCSKLEQVPDQT